MILMKSSYQGSLTTPPCSDGVQFILSASKIELSWMHYNNLKALVKFNSRPVQNDLGFENALLVAAEDISNASSSSDATSKRLMANRNHEVLVDQQEPLKEHPLEHNLL
jgi:Eukaryotic-type carbonic anhydrase